MTSSPAVHPADSSFRAALRLTLLFAAIKLLLQFALTLWTTHLGYGYFRDEFYYLACGHHLAWGYVDHGPIVALQACLGEILFGESIFAIRILAAAAGALTVFLTGILAWSLGGRRPAQALAMFALILAPEYIGVGGFLSMNSWEPVFWIFCALALVLMLNGASERLGWILFGLSAGIGLLNKPSIVFFLVAVGIGLLLTPQRRILFTRWAALGIALLIVITLPYLHWQIHNHWPTLEFFHNGKVGHKNVILGPWSFFLAQFAQMHPVNALLWIAGLVSLLRARSIRHARWLGLTYLVFFALMFALHAKDYYLAPIYPVLFAAGAIAWERRFATSRSVARDRIFAFPIFETVLILTGVLILPMASPVLRPATWVRYTTALHLKSGKTETGATSELPQFYADRFGWRRMVAGVADAYNSLSPADRAQACIVGGNYGEAGAVDFFNRVDHLGLPPAISGHNNYWLWGPHGCTGRVVLDISGATPAELRAFYGNVLPVASLDNPWAMPSEHTTIYILRDRKQNLQQDWPGFKNYF